MVEAIDRLGRNYDEVIQTVNYLKQKKCKKGTKIKKVRKHK